MIDRRHDRHSVSRAAAEPRLAVMVRPGKLGIGSAHVLGWMQARNLGYRRIVTLDADFSHDPGDIPRLLAALDQGADVVIGSRFAAGSRLDYVGWRRFVSRSANYLARTALGLPISEYTTSLRAARLDRVPEGLVETIESGGYSFFLICMVRFVRAGLKVTEIPIHFHQRTEGTSKISHLEIVRGALNLVRPTLRRKWQNRYALAGGLPMIARPAISLFSFQRHQVGWFASPARIANHDFAGRQARRRDFTAYRRRVGRRRHALACGRCDRRRLGGAGAAAGVFSRLQFRRGSRRLHRAHRRRRRRDGSSRTCSTCAGSNAPRCCRGSSPPSASRSGRSARPRRACQSCCSCCSAAC